jgi:uncharacterized membrane protein YcjF (UPF0283 family)
MKKSKKELSKEVDNEYALTTQATTATTEEADSEPKMTIYEYEEKYVRHQNVTGAKLVLKLIVAVIAIFLVWCLFSISKQIWDINQYAGYGAGVLSLLLYIFLFIVPVVKIFKSDYFITNVNSKLAPHAKKHNRELRRKISEKIIDFNNSVDGVGWYDGRVVDELEVAFKRNDDAGIKKSLTELYQGKIKKSARDIIVKSSLKSAVYSAISQTSKTDSALVAVVNLQMIKDIVFLYGFRPSDARLVKIFARVLQNSLIAYGLGGLKIGNNIVATMGNAVKGIPILGTAISTLVDSSVQGLTNGTLTAVIGYQTIKYLNTEYRLQDILDGIEVGETEEELKETCVEIESQLKKNPIKKTAQAV